MRNLKNPGLPDTLFLKFKKFCTDQKLFAQGDKILVALSGGADSVLLLHFLIKLKSLHALQLVAVHLNHQLRGEESVRDRDFCVELCNSLNVELIVKELPVKEYSTVHKISIEMAARDLRYQSLQNLLTELKYDKIATGHNLDDNAETVILNLIKGKGLKAVSGIPVKRDNLIRPLLSIAKKEIVRYLETIKSGFVTDSSNFESTYQRNLIRNEVFPLFEKINPRAGEALFRFSEMMHSLPASIIPTEPVTSSQDGKILVIDLAAVKKSNEFNLYNELSIRFIELFSLNLKFENFYTLNELFEAQSGKKISLGNNLIAVRTRDNVLVSVKNEEFLPEIDFNPGDTVEFGNFRISCHLSETGDYNGCESKNVEYIDGDKIAGSLTVRPPKKGEWFLPVNGKGKRKVSDFFNDIKLEPSKKWSHPIVSSGDQIVWICGFRLDDRFKITNETKRIYKLEIETYG